MSSIVHLTWLPELSSGPGGHVVVFCDSTSTTFCAAGDTILHSKDAGKVTCRRCLLAVDALGAACSRRLTELSMREP